MRWPDRVLSIMPPEALRLLPLLLMLLACPRGAAAATSLSLYDIRIDGTESGISSVQWSAPDQIRQGNASTELPGALVQHDQLQIDAAGFPIRYRLEADVQGHHTRVDVQRHDDGLDVTIDQDDSNSTRHFASAEPVDIIDNNSLDGLQALLDRLRGQPAHGSTLRVFVPQALAFGTLAFDKSTLTQESFEGAQRRLRSITASLTVKGKRVPLTLWLDPTSGQLLRFAQTSQQVTMTLRPPAPKAAPPATPASDGDCARSRRIDVRAGSDVIDTELTLPTQTGRPWPAMLLVAGSGVLDDSDALGAAAAATQIRRQLATALACHGIAVLNDSRHQVSGGGETSVATSAGHLADLLNVLQHQPGVDPTRLILAGHAEGGLIALYALTGLKPQPAGLVLLNTPGQALGDTLTEQWLAPAQALGAGAPQRESLKQSAEAALTAIRASRGQQLTLSGTLVNNRLARRMAPMAGLLREELQLDPIKLAAAVKIPLLIVQGSKDTAVPPNSASRFQQVADKAQQIDFPDMNHDLAESPLPALSARVNAPGSTVAPKLAPSLAAWILRQTPVRTGSRSARD